MLCCATRLDNKSSCYLAVDGLLLRWEKSLRELLYENSHQDEEKLLSLNSYLDNFYWPAFLFLFPLLSDLRAQKHFFSLICAHTKWIAYIFDTLESPYLISYRRITVCILNGRKYRSVISAVDHNQNHIDDLIDIKRRNFTHKLHIFNANERTNNIFPFS